MGAHLYGCDDCVDACPWNRWAQATREERFAARPLPDPAEILGWTQEDFDRELAGRAMRRTKLEGLRRNSCVVLGNIGTAADIQTLEDAAKDADAVVAEHARWAVRRIRESGTDAAT
jgi:epoxyqueuosine reductase